MTAKIVWIRYDDPAIESRKDGRAMLCHGGRRDDDWVKGWWEMDSWFCHDGPIDPIWFADVDNPGPFIPIKRGPALDG